MDFFYLIKEDDKKLAPLSPKVVRRLSSRNSSNSPGRSARVGCSSLPELSETDHSACEGRDPPTEAEKQDLLSTEDKLRKARKKREEMVRIREITVHDKNKQAFQRAQQKMECERERLREKTSRVAKVKARRSLMEVKERERVLTSIENKLNGAMTRAEQINKKKQNKAKKSKRVERAKKRRELLEFERRSVLLSGVDRRSELAQKKVELMLKDRQCKAREEIEHALRVSRRVRAVKVLQRAFRSVFGDSSKPLQMNERAAAIRLQCWAQWRINAACHRLCTADEKNVAPTQSLKSVLSSMGYSSDTAHRRVSFEDLTAEMRRAETIAATEYLLTSFEPILRAVECVSERTLLSAFLVAQQPTIVLGPKRGDDKCSILLEKASHRLVKALVEVIAVNNAEAGQRNFAASVTKAASCVISYCTLFDEWKNTDIDDLMNEMKKSAVQSWIAFLTAKAALAYAEEKGDESSKEHDPLFQHKVRYKSTRRGASSHIKRIRASLDKLLGPEGGKKVMISARRSALSRIEEDGLQGKYKIEVDSACEAEEEKLRSEKIDNAATFDLNDAAALDDVNEHVVHEILLADNEDLKDRLFTKPEASIVDCVESYMAKFKSNVTVQDEDATVDTLTYAMEKSFFEHLGEDWLSNDDMSGVKETLVEMLDKMRNLVPKRLDLHRSFSNDLATGCKNASDVLILLGRMAELMCDSLESQYRAESTVQWLKATKRCGNWKTDIPFGFSDVESYAVASMAFLVKKLDICHSDVVNYRLMKVTPLIRQNGVYYERQKFQEKHGGNIDEMHGTRNWIARMESTRNESNHVSMLKKGFVDELLFVRERISMPEVLCLDAARISSIRERAQRIVICSSLLLHACNISQCRISSFQSTTSTSKVRHHKVEILKALKGGLPYDELFKRTSVAVVAFARAICKKELKESELSCILSKIDAVLKGSDAVISLMDKRVRQIFQIACAMEPCWTNQSGSTAPQSMATGIKRKTTASPSLNAQKEMLTKEVTKKALKDGFNFVVDDLVEATYDAFKVIDHCVKVHEDDVFIPMLNQLKN